MIKMCTYDPVDDRVDPCGWFWRVRGYRKTSRGAIKLRRKIEREGYDKDVSICWCHVEKKGDKCEC